MHVADRRDVSCVKRAARRCREANAIANTRRDGERAAPGRALREVYRIVAVRSQQLGEPKESAEAAIRASLVVDDAFAHVRIAGEQFARRRRAHDVDWTTLG